jgi:hypothetical protein
MKNLTYSTLFFLIMNVMVAIIMAVSGFNFTFPNPDMPEVHGYYIWYGVLEFIETQCGSYLGEDDIIRYDDDYGRV